MMNTPFPFLHYTVCWTGQNEVSMSKHQMRRKRTHHTGRSPPSSVPLVPVCASLRSYTRSSVLTWRGRCLGNMHFSKRSHKSGTMRGQGNTMDKEVTAARDETSLSADLITLPHPINTTTRTTFTTPAASLTATALSAADSTPKPKKKQTPDTRLKCAGLKTPAVSMMRRSDTSSTGKQVAWGSTPCTAVEEILSRNDSSTAEEEEEEQISANHYYQTEEAQVYHGQ